MLKSLSPDIPENIQEEFYALKGFSVDGFTKRQ
jgi:hypothetical protein